MIMKKDNKQQNLLNQSEEKSKTLKVEVSEQLPSFEI